MDRGTTKAIKFVHLCGGYAGAIDAIMDLTRLLWNAALRAADIEKEAKEKAHRFISKDELLMSWGRGPEVLALILDELGASDVETTKEKADLNNDDEVVKKSKRAQQRKPILRELANGQIVFSLELLGEFGVARRVLGDLRPDHQLRYHVMRHLRNHYGFAVTPATVRFLHLLANTVNNAYKTGYKQIIRFEQDLIPRLTHALENDAQTLRDPASIINLFVEGCREVGYLRINHFESDALDLKTSVFDATYLISNLYGMPSGIKGFDELFGGGIMFAEDLHSAPERALGGRTVLIRGPFGTGKSLLSLQLAAEVASKGGLAWIMPLEQSADECRYTLESINALPNDQSVIIAKNSKEAAEVLAKCEQGRGALIILRTMKDSFDDFLTALEDNAKRMSNYGLRLICVDPVNSINRPESDEAKLRAKMLDTLDAIERAGTNVLLVAEEGNDRQKDLLFEQNIADTVIQLSVKKAHGYASRIFEISKSRLQREQRGEHPFSIVSGVGVRIYPSSASVNARTRPRSIRRREKDAKFGLQSLDNLLGKEAMSRGDVIVFQGAGGSFKTQLGLLFLLGADWRGQQRSLLVAARDNEATIDYLLEQDFIRHFKGQKHRSDIRLCELPRGHVHPGLILQRIEDELREARLEETWIDRVMVDNIAHWELSSPFVREDETFGDTLLDFLRRQRTTNLIVCSDVGNDGASVVQRLIIDGADCVVQFERFEFRGVRRVMVRVLKTRGMKHRREAFELSLTPQGLDVKPSSSLLRIMRDGETATVKVRLFFKTKNSIQQRYNERIIEGLKSVLTEHIENDSKDRIYTTRAKALALSSAVDELQVIQLDEFQLPDISDFPNQELLFRFLASQWNEDEWADFLCADRIRISTGSFFAVPYFHNVSLLAYHKEELNKVITKHKFNTTIASSWLELADACARWEEDNPDPNQFFFDFPKASTEHFNCLFLEILLYLGPPPTSLVDCQLKEWLKTENAIKAAKIFRQLTRRAYNASVRHFEGIQEMQKGGEGQVSPAAVVWRHWYTTLNQMLSQMAPSDRVAIEVKPLPGNISIAGEWYCGITSYSAAPDVGLEIIRLLTSREAEMDRLQVGVGLPTRKEFYKNSGEGFVSPYFSMNLGTLSTLVEHSFRRSAIGCYVDFSNVLAFHLQRIIEIPEDPQCSIDDSISSIFKSLQARFDFMRPNAGCSKCALARH